MFSLRKPTGGPRLFCIQNIRNPRDVKGTAFRAPLWFHMRCRSSLYLEFKIYKKGFFCVGLLFFFFFWKNTWVWIRETTHMPQLLTAHDLTCHLILVAYNQHTPHCSLIGLSLCSCWGKKIPREFPSWWDLAHQYSSERLDYWVLGMGRLQVGKRRSISFTEPEVFSRDVFQTKHSLKQEAERTSGESQSSFPCSGGFDSSEIRNSRQDRVASVITAVTKHRQPREEVYSRNILWPCTVDRHFPVPSNKLQDLQLKAKRHRVHRATSTEKEWWWTSPPIPAAAENFACNCCKKQISLKLVLWAVLRFAHCWCWQCWNPLFHSPYWCLQMEVGITTI